MIEAKLNNNVLYVKGCLPHYRRPLAEILAMRSQIADALRARGVMLPLKGDIHLRVAARRHFDGGDLSNVVQGVCQALDGGTLGRPNAILEDDGQVVTLSARWVP